MSTLTQRALPLVIHRYFEVSLFLLVTVGFLALASTGRLDLYSLLIVSVALAAKALRYSRHPGPELTSGAVTLLTAFYLLFYFADVFLLSRGFVLATTHLVLFVAVVRIYSARTNRDYLWLAAVAFLEILAAAVLTVDTSFLLFFLLFLVLAIATFVSFEIKRNLETLSEQQVAPDTGGYAARLPRTLTFTAWSVALAVLAVSGVLFFILPRHNFGYLSDYDFRTQQMSGFTDEVTLGDIGSIKQNHTVVMRIKSLDGETTALQGLHWRGLSLATFDGHRWFTLPGRRRTTLRGGAFRQYGLPFRPLQHIPTRVIRYRVLREPVSTRNLFAAAVPVRIQGRFPRLIYSDDQALYLRRWRPVAMNYEVTSHIATRAAGVLRATPQEYRAADLARHMQGTSDASQALEAYLQLPELDPRIAGLARDLAAPHDNNYDKARAIEQHLRTEYGYTLELLSAPVEDPIAHFLFERREGHCEYYASAMVVMLRSQGIPARIVNGFLTGEYNEVSDNFIVRASDAHTWVEMFFPTVGWVEFDPTPPDPNAAPRDFWMTMRHYYDAFDLWWDEWVINYDVWQQFQMARATYFSMREWTQSFREWVRATRHSASHAATRVVEDWLGNPYAAAGLAGFALLLVAAVWRRKILGWILEFRLLRRGDRGALTASEATLAYNRLLRILKRKGFRKAPTDTPLEFASALPPRGLSTDVLEFTRLYNGSRFGVTSEDSPRMIALLRQVEIWKPSTS